MMPAMPTRPVQTSTPSEHEEEKATQEKIAAEIAPTPTPVVDAAPEASIEVRSVNVATYPLYVSVVGADEDLYFPDESATVKVTPAVAEQLTYIQTVEVVA